MRSPRRSSAFSGCTCVLFVFCPPCATEDWGWGEGLLHWSTHSSSGAPTILLEPPFAVLILSMPPLRVFNYLSAFLSPSNPLNLSCEMHTILSRHGPFEVNGNLQTTTTIKNKHGPSAMKCWCNLREKSLEVVFLRQQHLIFSSFVKVPFSKDLRSRRFLNHFYILILI